MSAAAILALLVACDGSADDTGVAPAPQVEVPSGAFVMGCDAASDPGCDADESPVHEVTVAAFAIDRLEVSVADFAACLAEGVCRDASPGAEADEDPDLPRTGVAIEQAARYCDWRGMRLPTEAEWEKAARGADQRAYPWGDTPGDCLAALPGCGDRLTPVGSHPEDTSPYGALDMGGNAWEWVSDWYDDDYYAESPAGNPDGPESTGLRVVRGASHWADDGAPRVTNREPAISGASCPICGFRCVVER